MTWIVIGEKITKFLHFLTGWIVHPDCGGCCHEKDILSDVLSDNENKKEN